MSGSGIILAMSGELRKARAVNQTGAFLADIPKTWCTRSGGQLTPQITDAVDTTATGLRYHDLRGGQQGDGRVPGALLVIPYGLHATPDNKVFRLRVNGIRRTAGPINEIGRMAFAVPLIDVDLTTTGSYLGVAGQDMIATEAFCDTVTLVDGNDDVVLSIYSPENDTPGYFIVATLGCPFVQFNFAATNSTSTGTSATSFNAWWCPLT